ncbi:MAG TPA: hypothetical protein VHP33_16975 [Polyangiaceae bacterium]|nr:hypothetical protein [Polyangiaceae bacterium]
MTDPSRLLDSAAHDFERTLLGSALTDRGSDAAQARALAALGSLGAGLLVSSGAVASGAALASARGGFATLATPKVTLAVLVKWIGTGVVVGVVSAGGVQALVDAPPVTSSPAQATLPSPPPSSSAVIASTVRTVEPALPVAAPSTTAIVREKSRPLEEEAPEGVAAHALSSSNVAFPAEASDSGLGEELRSLEQVRGALRSGDAAGSIAALERYQARFPRGALAREATLLAVEAKLAAGDVAGARAEAARVLATDRASPHAKRIQALLSARGIQ